MAVLKCKMCGGQLNVEENVAVIECEYCGSKQTISNSANEEIKNLFNRANTLRLRCEFDKAEAVYERILSLESEESEAYWGVILCKFGVEYVIDPQTSRRMPTCHRTSYDSIVSDEYYKNCIKYCDVVQKSIYEQEAKCIDEIQKNILSISANEKPYDVFICYKETDENGKRTKDSVIANDIYYELTEKGYKVFYAAITLEDKIGNAYEPIIFAALNSSKVMLSIGTKPEYFNAVWVKNEWSRFLKMIKNNRSKILIPCYRDMDAYDLPEEFAHLQALDMSKIGFVQDLIRGIEKIIVVDTKSSKKTTEPPLNSILILKRIQLFIEYGEFDEADEYCDKLLDSDPENGHAYLYKFMCDMKVKNLDELSSTNINFTTNANYKRALRFGNEEIIEKLSILRYSHINLNSNSKRKSQTPTIEEKKECTLTPDEYQIYYQKDKIISEYNEIKNYDIEAAAKEKFQKQLILGVVLIVVYYIGIFVLIKRYQDKKKFIEDEKKRVQQIKDRYNELQRILEKQGLC